MKFKKVTCSHCGGTKRQPVSGLPLGADGTRGENYVAYTRDCPWCINGYIEIEDKERIK